MKKKKKKEEKKMERWIQLRDEKYLVLSSADIRWESRSWAKKVTGVDDSKNNGYAFEGTFLYMAKGKKLILKENEVEEGDVILVIQDIGSNQYHRQYAYVFLIKNGKLEEKLSKVDFREDIRLLKKSIKELLIEGKKVDKTELCLKELEQLKSKYGCEVFFEALRKISKS
jgi:hypothetical protein